MQNSQLNLGPLISGAFALIVVLGATQPWERTLYIPTNGTETDQGFFTLILGVGALAFCAARAFYRISRSAFFGGAFVTGALALLLAAWFLYDLETAEAEFLGQTFNISEITEASSGVYYAIGGAIGLLASLAVQVATGIVRQQPQALSADN